MSKRFNSHKNKLKKGTHVNKHLQASYERYPKDVWDFEIFEYCEVDDDILNEREIYYIKLYDTTNREFGFNMESGGAEGAREIGRKQAKPIYQIDFKGNIVKYWMYGAKQAQRVAGYNAVAIGGCLKHRESTYKGHIWIYENEYDKESFDIYEHVGLSRKFCPVVQLTMEGEFVAEFLTPKEAGEKTGCASSNISSCCLGAQSYHANYKWVFARDYYRKK